METSEYFAQKKIIFVFAIIIFVAGWYFYSQYYTRGPTNQDQYSHFYQKANSSFTRGDFDTSIEQFQSAIPFAPNKNAEAQLKLKTATALIGRRQDGDLEEAVRLYKEVINDGKVAPLWHAFALSNMAFAFDILLYRDNTLYHAVFRDEPYAGYLQESTTGTFGTLQKIYESSDAIFPNAFAKTMIAMKYAIPLLDHGEDKNLGAEKTAEIITQYITDAKPLINQLPYEKSILAYMHLAIGESYNAIEFRLHTIGMEKVEIHYKEALALAESDAPENIHSHGVAERIRLWYAVALATHSGEKRADDIKKLIDPIVSAKPPYGIIQTYIGSIAARPQNSYIYKGCKKIAAILPEFQSLLADLDWKL